MATSLEPFISVIIPVFNDREPLKLCLSALAEQTYPQYRYEVIVIDNGSDDWKEVKAIVNSFDGVILSSESIPGSYAARNKGLTIAKGEVIAFTDADCIPAPNWLEAGVQILTSTPNCGLVAGAIKLFSSNHKKPTMVEVYESIRALPQQEFIEQNHYGATANVFTTKDVIKQVGVFDAQLKSSGDMEWGQRVYQKGYRQVYTESVVVHHPTHSTWREFYVRTKRLAGGHYDLQLKQAQTAWQRQIVFLRILLFNLTPPVFSTFNTLSNTQIKGIGQKIILFLMMSLVRYVSAWETVQLKLGKASSRA